MIQIRQMREQDVEKVAELEGEIFSMPWSVQGFLDTLHMDNVHFLLAEEGEEILGYCGLYTALDEGEITNVAVKAQCRKSGIGSQILEALLKLGEQNSVTRFFLEVRVSNISAQKLYEKYGFLVCGRRKGFYEKPKEDAYIMCREENS